MGTYNLLILSDIHLGSTLVEHVRRAEDGHRQVSPADTALVGFLDWYREHRRDNRPWRLVIAGDLVDFSGMSLNPWERPFETGPTKEEELHGLGNAVDHTLHKLRRVAEHHAAVFTALARFVSAGNQLVIVHGNHDVEFHWPRVRREFVELLEAKAPLPPRAIRFKRWFHYEPERVYIEHGHQYDPYCSHDYVLVPLCPRDQKRCSRSLSDIFVRCVVRPTLGLTESGHDTATAFDYLRFAWRLGLGGLARLSLRFLRAIYHLFQTYRSHFSRAARTLAREHDRRVRRLAVKTRLQLQALLALQSKPITHSWLGTLSSVMLDRVLTAGAALALSFACWLLAASWQQAMLLNLVTLVPMLAVGAVWMGSRCAVDPRNVMRERAQQIARFAPAAFIVMGHTHVPERYTASPGTTYVNLGAWAEESHDQGFAPPCPATRTHLVLVHSDGETHGELLQWQPTGGPRRYPS